MKVIIREGSAAKNFEALVKLIDEHYENMMFCSDDKHPDDLLIGHINELCGRAVSKGINVFKVLQAACINPIHHYNLNVGYLQIGHPADCVVVEDLTHFKAVQTCIDGELVFDKGVSKIKDVTFETINNFNTDKKQVFQILGLSLLPKKFVSSTA